MQVYSVRTLVDHINSLLYEEIAVEGEVSGYSISQNRWIFFTLKDEQTAVECFSMTFRMTEPIEDGMRVQVIGYPKVHEKSGRFRIIVEKVVPIGAGALKRAYELLKKNLATEGLFAEGRKRALPRFPKRIGLITSKDAAAYSDFLRILQNRWSGVEVIFAPAKVQGVGAEESLIAALCTLNAFSSEKCIDSIVLTRGGGSLEDLHAFNAERVARAVYASKVPIVCAVGHERDESLCDFVADVRASTPSNAAERVVPDRKEVWKEVQFIQEHLTGAIDGSMRTHTHLLNSFVERIESHMKREVRRGNEIFERFSRSFIDFFKILSSQRERVLALERILRNVNPIRVLERGYSITRTKDGRILTNVSRIRQGEEVRVQLTKGTFTSEVKTIQI